MTVERLDTEAFYSWLFIEDPVWSTRYPNLEEARRAAKILPLLSERARGRTAGLRILDLGCGRGWLTNIANAYGDCLGTDPVRPVVEFARERFPGCASRSARPATSLPPDGPGSTTS